MNNHTVYSFEIKANRYCGHFHRTIGAAVQCAVKLCGKSACKILPPQFVASEAKSLYRPLNEGEAVILTAELDQFEEGNNEN